MANSLPEREATFQERQLVFETQGGVLVKFKSLEARSLPIPPSHSGHENSFENSSFRLLLFFLGSSRGISTLTQQPQEGLSHSQVASQTFPFLLFYWQWACGYSWFVLPLLPSASGPMVAYYWKENQNQDLRPLLESHLPECPGYWLGYILLQVTDICLTKVRVINCSCNCKVQGWINSEAQWHRYSWWSFISFPFSHLHPMTGSPLWSRYSFCQQLPAYIVPEELLFQSKSWVTSHPWTNQYGQGWDYWGRAARSIPAVTVELAPLSTWGFSGWCGSRIKRGWLENKRKERRCGGDSDKVCSILGVVILNILIKKSACDMDVYSKHTF